MKVVEIVPHGLCNGVRQAVAKALALKDVYCLDELVHNEIVIGELKALGYRFVDSVAAVPRGATVVFPAHGVSPAVRSAAAARGLKIVDLTCPYVERAHRAVRAAASRGNEVVILGDARHAEVKGLRGELAKPVRAGAKGRRPLSVICQTTLNLEAARREVAKLAKGRELKEVSWPCAATRERQDAVREFCAVHHSAQSPAAVLVLGGRNSANSQRLRQIAVESGASAYFASTMDEVRKLRDELSSYDVVGVTSGASTPERFYMEVTRMLNNIPQHVAMIMDGNGRWARRRGKARGEGHVAGAKTLSKVVKWCGERGIRYLTVYAFSTENWQRSKDEVAGLMKLFALMMKTREAALMKNRVRFRVIGRRGDLSPSLQKTIAALERKTAKFERQLIVSISYGGRAEIVDAVNRAVAAGTPVTEETFRDYLYAPDVPDPDLIIRTSGEQRTSNFLLWESAYSEYFFTDTLWPDFSEADLDAALAAYATRDRRKGNAR